MTSVIIIEDEPKAAKELSHMLMLARPDWRVVQTIESIEDAIEWFQHHPAPDIIFSDIQLSDGVSFEIFRQVKIETPIIFCTAYDEYMLKAFETTGIAYLLKPIVPAKLEESLRKYEELKTIFNKNQTPSENNMEALLRQLRPSYLSTLLIQVRGKIIPVKADDIGFLFYNNGVVLVCLLNGHQYFVEEKMETMEENLNPSLFYRVNRQFIINRNSILEIEKYLSRKLIVKLNVKTPEPVVVGKLKTTEFLAWIAGGKE